MVRQLTDMMVRQVKLSTNGKSKKYPDGGQMYLLVSKTSKCWRYNYKFAGKYKTLALGVYPAVSLMNARLVHEKARELISRNIDPAEHRCRVPCDHGHIPERSYALYKAREVLQEILNDSKEKV
jgi:hypothetical protein